MTIICKKISQSDQKLSEQWFKVKDKIKTVHAQGKEAPHLKAQFSLSEVDIPEKLRGPQKPL